MKNSLQRFLLLGGIYKIKEAVELQQKPTESERQDSNLRFTAYKAAAQPSELRSDMHHIPKGAPYFRIARPLRFQISHSTGFLVTNRRRIRFTICFDWLHGRTFKSIPTSFK